MNDSSAPPDLKRIARIGVHISSYVSMAVGLFWLTAWFNGSAAIWATSDFIIVKTNTALCLFLTGLSLLLTWREDAPRWQKAVGGAAALLVLLIGLLTVSQHLFGVDLGIDQLIATEPPGARATASPNRMGPPASSCFFFAGTGLIALALGFRTVAPYLGLAVILIMSVPVVGYLGGVTTLYEKATVTGIAWSTVLALFFVSIGLMLANFNGPPLTTLFRQDPGGQWLRRLLPAAIMLPLLLGLMRFVGEQSGLFSRDTGRGLLLISMMLVFCALVWNGSLWISQWAAVERKAAEDSLKAADRLRQAALESELARGQLTAVFNSVADGVAVCNMSGGILMVNRAEARMHGFSHPDEMKRDLNYLAGFFEITDAEGGVVPVGEWPVSRVMRGESFQNLKIHRRRLDTGRFGFYSLSGECVRDENGKPILGVIVTRDITEQQQRESLLRQSEERFRGLAEGMPHTVWETDANGINLYQNQVWYDYVGKGPGSSFGNDWITFFHPEDQQRLINEWTKTVKSGGAHVYDTEARLRRHDGEYRWFRVKGAPIRDTHGAVQRWVGTCTDIEDQKQIARQMAIAKESAEEANRAKDHFLAVLGHELRNPLAPIRNSIEVMKRVGLPNPSLERARQIIERQADHMTRLIEELLDISRIERGKITLQKEELDLTRLVRLAVEDHRTLVEGNGLSLQFAATDVPVFVFGDSARLTQVVGNLVNNAVKFTDRGGNIWIEVAMASDHEAMISVRDSGIGLDASTLDKIFEPFSQADRSLERSRGGLGLGLALVKGLVKLHGGSVKASSPGLGKGSNFVISLPILQSKAAPAEENESSRKPSRAQKILVVDDNIDAAETLGEMLTIFGHETRWVHSGRAALMTAAEFMPDVVLCDIGMPGMSGYEVAQAFRNDPALRATYLIAMTGYGQEEDKRLAKRAGFDHHITKPAEPEMLERLLAR